MRHTLLVIYEDIPAKVPIYKSGSSTHCCRNTCVIEKDLQSIDSAPELGQSHSTRSILVSDEILSRSINIPPVCPGPHRQCNLFPHETPRNVRIKRNIYQKFGSSKEKPSSYERNLRRSRFVSLIPSSGIDTDYRVRIQGVRFTMAETAPIGLWNGSSVPFLKSRWVGTQHRFGVISRGSDFYLVLFIPVFGELQMRVRLNEIRLSAPQFGGIIPGHGWTQTFRFMNVQGSNLPVVTVYLIFRHVTKFLDPVSIHGGIRNLCHVFSFLVLANDLCPRLAGLSTRINGSIL